METTPASANNYLLVSREVNDNVIVTFGATPEEAHTRMTDLCRRDIAIMLSNLRKEMGQDSVVDSFEIVDNIKIILTHPLIFKRHRRTYEVSRLYDCYSHCYEIASAFSVPVKPDYNRDAQLEIGEPGVGVAGFWFNFIPVDDACLEYENGDGLVPSIEHCLTGDELVSFLNENHQYAVHFPHLAPELSECAMAF